MSVVIDNLSMSSPHSPTPFTSDVVNYKTRPTAPLIIPIVFFIVVGALLLCIIIKLLLRIWDRHHKSDSYKFVDEEAKLNLTLNEKNHGKSDPKLISSLIYVGDRKKANNNDDTSNNGSVTIEANVHDSSAETNETEIANDSDHATASNNVNDHIPMTLTGSSRVVNSRATESDV